MFDCDCPHYKTAAKILAPCCNKMYRCRICHNENENHILDTSVVRAIICLRCNQKQTVSNECNNCHIQFGEYFCLLCKLYDEKKNQYHCNACGICRIGPETSYFHCPKCNLCLNKLLVGNHKCQENVSRNLCKMCSKDLHTSRDLLSVFKCGHILHKKCFEQLGQNSVCPICKDHLRLAF